MKEEMLRLFGYAISANSEKEIISLDRESWSKLHTFSEFSKK